MKRIGNYTVKHSGRPRILDYDKIKALMLDGVKNKDIAKEYRCHPGYVSVLRREFGLRKKRGVRG